MCAKPNCTDHILYRSLNRELFASLHVCVLNWELTPRRQIIAVGKWECYEAHTPSCDPGLLQELHWHVFQKKFIVMKCNLYVFMCVFVCVSGCVLGPHGGIGGGCVQDGAGVRLPAGQMWRCGLGPCGAAQRPLPPFRHSALWPHCYRGYYSITAHTTAHPRTGVYTYIQ